MGEREVRVWHDGVAFDAKDVVGVLSIGQTTKGLGQIGLFGVGFVLVDMRVRKLFKRLLATPMRHSDFLLVVACWSN